NSLPAPVIDVHLYCRIGLHIGRRVDAGFLAVARNFLSVDPARSVLTPHGIFMDLFMPKPPDRTHYVHLTVTDFFRLKGNRRLHGNHTQYLQQVVLDHVAQSAGILKITAAVLDTYLLGNGNLYIVDIVAVPQRFKQRVGKPERQDILDGLLSEVVVYTVDLLFLKRAS